MAPISFDSVPANQRVPFAYIEFDNSGAARGTNEFKVLVLGQRLAAGTVAKEVPTKVTSAAQARTYFGVGSMLYSMLEHFFHNEKGTEVTVVALDDDGAAVAADGSITYAGNATADGTLYLYIAGRRVKVAVASGDAASAVATKVAAAINADTTLPVTAAVDGVTAEKVNITARNKGVAGNDIDLRHNYYAGEELPKGITVGASVAMANGATNPDIAGAIAVLDDTQYNVVVMPYTDAANLTALESELATRWGPNTQNDGHAITAKLDSHANLVTFGNGRNSPHVSCIGFPKSPLPSYDQASAVAAIIAQQAAIDPARPFQNVAVKSPHAFAPAPVDRLTQAERNLLLFDGISTLKIGGGDTVFIERIITMYQTNAAGASDTSYLDANTIFTLSYIRRDYRNSFLGKFPRHKLASDGTRFGAGQAVITPNIARAFAIGKFDEWETKGLVEGFAQFKKDLVVERNADDPNRLDTLMPPDLINQLRVHGVKIKFLL